jgi:hypothetical protein
VRRIVHVYDMIQVDPPTEQSPKTFFEIPVDQRRQLARSQYEMVCYLPWREHPDATFLAQDVRDFLDRHDDEKGCR